MKTTKNWCARLVLIALMVLIGPLGPRTSSAQGKARSASEAVKVGLMVTDINNINFPENEITVEFYMWFDYAPRPGANFEPAKTVRIVNAKEVELVPLGAHGPAGPEGIVSHLVRGTAVVKKNWTVADYPFDGHTIRMYIEDNAQLARNIVFVPDSVNSKMDPELKLAGWDFHSLKLESQTRKWATTFGTPAAPDRVGQSSTSTSRLVASFKIGRSKGGADLFFKVFSGVILSIVIAFLGLVLPPAELEVRAGLMVGALFAAVGSQFTLATFLPPSAIPTLVDSLHAVAFGFIGATVFVAVRTSILMHREREADSNRVNRAAMLLLLPILCALIAAVLIYYFNADFSTPPYY